MELQRSANSLSAEQVAFFRKFPIKSLFYMDLPEPTVLLKDVDGVNTFLNSTSETRILVSHKDYRSDLAGVLPEEMLSRPTLEEKVNPWEKDRKYEAWIVKGCK